MTDENGPLSQDETKAIPEGWRIAPEQPSETSHLAAGSLIERRYRVIELLGRGGMGEVFKAEDISLHQTVALKCLPASLAGDEGALDRVREEVRMARRVSHRNVCRVHDLGGAGSQLFISMEYVDGEDLATLLHRVGRLAGDRAIEIARELCAGLAAAHAAGVIHRDLKPANVMLDREGRVRITDFGLAVLGGEPGAVGELAGTPAYMAPEQLAGMGATVRSDLYALGLVLYELFTGRKAYPAATTLSELRRLRRETVLMPPGQVVRELDTVVERTILHCLGEHPEARPESVLAVLTALSGGDPLKAAFDAGQTPSPSAVAAAQVEGRLAPIWAWASLGVVGLTLAILLTVGPSFSALDRIHPSLPPAALAVKAEEMIRTLGHDDVYADDASGFAYDDGALRRAASVGGDPAQRAEAVAAERRSIVFWHRCGPVPLQAWGRVDVTPRNPPLGPGESLVVLDLNGRLLRFQHTPSAEGGSKGVADSLLTLLQLAGLDPAPPIPSRPNFFREDGPANLDARMDGTVPARLEAEFRGGRIIRASVVTPWTPPIKFPASQILDPSSVPSLFILLLTLVSLPLAIRNLRAGRGDRQGARRVGLLVFGLALAAELLTAHHAWNIGVESTVLRQSLAWSLYYGIRVTLLYLALEPLVRRAWPERLVSWTRLLAGKVRDPIVARDVLLGMAGYFGLGALLVPVMLMTQGHRIPTKHELDPLMGSAQCLAAVAASAIFAVQIGLIFLLLLLLLRAIGRVRGLAPALFIGIFTTFLSVSILSLGVSLSLAVPLALAFAAVMFLLLTRLGLLAMASTLFFSMLIINFPNAVRFTGWTAFCAWWPIGISVLVAIYGLYYATGGRPFGDRELLES